MTNMTTFVECNIVRDNHSYYIHSPIVYKLLFTKGGGFTAYRITIYCRLD